MSCDVKQPMNILARKKEKMARREGGQRDGGEEEPKSNHTYKPTSLQKIQGMEE